MTGSVDDAEVAKDVVIGLSDAECSIFEELNARNGRWFIFRLRSSNAGRGIGRDGRGLLDDLDVRIKEAKKACLICAQPARQASAST